MRAVHVLLLLALGSGCSRSYFSGALDLARVQRGEVFMDTVALPDGRLMFRAVLTVEATPAAVLSVYRDVEGFASWQSSIVAASVTHADGDVLEAEITFAPIYGRKLAPVPNVIRLDVAGNEVSLAGFENDWLRSSQTVIKAEAMADGVTTLVTAYSTIDVKAFGASLGKGRAEELLAQGMLNLKSVVKLPKHARQATSATAAPRGRIAVPTFRAEGVPEELARTLTRVFARELMRTGKWQVVTYEEAAALLAHAQREELIGCDPAHPCAAELGKALAADRLISGQIGKVGAALVASIAVVEFPGGKVLARTSTQDADETALLGRMRAAAIELAGP